MIYMKKALLSLLLASPAPSQQQLYILLLLFIFFVGNTKQESFNNFHSWTLIRNATYDQKLENTSIQQNILKKKGNVYLSNNSPTFLGEETVVDITLIWILKRHKYLYKWRSIESSGQVNTNETSVSVKLFTCNTLPGLKTIYFSISYEKKPGVWFLVAKNETVVECKDSIFCHIKFDETLNKGNRVNVGESRATVYSHDPNHILKKHSYSWHFDDVNSTVFTKTNTIKHNYTKEGTFNITAKVQAISIHNKLYNGVCYYEIFVKAVLKFDIIIWQNNRSSSPHLPSLVLNFAPGTVNYLVKLVDPYHIFKTASVRYTFDFGSYLQTLNVNKTTHIYNHVGTFITTVMINANISNRQYYAQHNSTKLIINYPIKALNVIGGSSIEPGQLIPFKISCNGSYPVSFCWYVTVSNCDLPKDLMCSPTLIGDQCLVFFNHTFQKSGKYCVNASAVNYVGSAYVLHYVHVKDPSSKTGGHRITILATALPIVAILLLALSIFIAMKRTGSKLNRGSNTEEARFDFRKSQSVHENIRRSWGSLTAPLFKCSTDCFKQHCNDDDIDTEGSEDEEFPLVNPNMSTSSRHSLKPLRKVSYYGTVHMTLLQHNQPIIAEEVADEGASCVQEVTRFQTPEQRSRIFSQTL